MDISSKLDILLQKNLALPLEKRLSLDKFILDDAVFKEKLSNAEVEIKTECVWLEKEAAELDRATKTVVQSFWLDMQVANQTITGFLDNDLAIRNMPLLQEISEEGEEFRRELMRNEMYVSVTRFIAFSPWELMSESELVEKQHKSPLDLRSFKRIAEGFQKMLSDAARRASDVHSGAPAGSISRSILTPDQSQALVLLENCDQVELNLSAYEATKHALVLSTLIRDLKALFNETFNDVKQERREIVEECADKLNDEQRAELNVFHDLDLMDVVKCKAMPTVRERRLNTVALSDKNMKRLKESLSRFDDRLKALLKFRLQICTAVTQEELKVARIKLWILAQSILLSNERHTREELRECTEAVEALTKRRQVLQVRHERKRRRHERLKAQDKRQDKTFQQHFKQNTPPAVVQQLSKLYMRRPAIKLSASQLRMLNKDLEHQTKPKQQGTGETKLQSEDESEEESAVPLREPCKLYMAALKIMDVTTRKSSVDTTAWRALCKLRRAKVEAEIKVQATALELSEVETSMTRVNAELTLETNRQTRLQEKLDATVDKKLRLMLDIELQILLPLGQIEVRDLHDAKAVDEAVLVPRKVIRQINNQIRDAGAAKMIALTRAMRFREGQLQTAHWQLQNANLQLLITKDELKHVEKLPITSEIKKYLKGSQHLPSKVKDSYEKEIQKRRAEALATEDADLQRQKCRLRTENADLERQIEKANKILKEQKDMQPLDIPVCSIRLASERSRLERKFREQEQQLLELKEKLEKMKMRTFPTLFSVSF